MPIEVSSSGTMVTGDGIPLMRLFSLQGALRLERKGLRMSSRMSALTAAKRLGFTGQGFAGRTQRDRIENQVANEINKLNPQVERIYKDGAR